MKIYFALAFPQQCFCRGWQDFILRASVFTSTTSAQTSTRNKLVKLLTLLHISPRIRSIMCTTIAVQILLYRYCYMQCNVLFSQVKTCVLKIISDALFKFKSKDKYERKMLNRLKSYFKRKIYINSFCMSQVLVFFGTGKWTNGKGMKQNKRCLNMWRYRTSPIRWYKTWKQSLFHCNVNEEKEDE